MSIAHFKEYRSDTEEKYDPDKPAYAGSRHKKIKKDEYRKRKGLKAMTDDVEIDEGYEKTVSLWMKNAFSGVEFHFKNGSLYVDKGYRGKVARRMAVDKIKAPVGGIKDIKEAKYRSPRDYDDLGVGSIKFTRKKGDKKAKRKEEVEIDEEMSPEDIKSAIEPAKKQFDSEMAKNFPDKQFTTGAYGAPLGGGITFVFAVIPKAKAKGVDLLNAPAHSKYMMHLTDNFGKAIPMSKFSIGKIMGRLPVKFRKISAKSPSDAVKKMTDWFKKNKSEFEGLIKEEVEIDEKKKEKSPVFKGTPRQIRQQMKDWKKKNDKIHIGEEDVDEALLGPTIARGKDGKQKKVKQAHLFDNQKDAEKKAKEIRGKAFQNKRDGKWLAIVWREEVEVAEGKSAYEKEIAAFLKKGGKIKKLAVSKKEVAKAAAEFRKSHKKMTQKEIELSLEDEIEAQAAAEGVIVAEGKIFLITEEITAKDYDALKKGDTVVIEYGSAMSGGKASFKVSAKNVVGKAKVGKITLKSVTKPNSVKHYLYKRGNKVSMAQGDMGVSVKSFTKEEMELGEVDSSGIDMYNNKRKAAKAKILKKGTKVKVAHPAKGKGMVTGKIVRYDDQGPGSPFYVVDVGERRSEKVPAHKIKEEVDIFETQELQAKMALDDAGIKYSTKNNSITIKKSDKKKAQKAFEKSFKKGGWPTLKLEAATITEVLKSKDKSVIDAFYDKKPLEGRMLSTDGMTLEKSGMGSQQIARWKNGKIKITAVSDVKSTEEIVRYMKKSIPSGVFEDRDYRKEYDNYQGKPEQIARRSSRNQARRVMGDKTEEGKDVGHKDNNPLNNDPKNLRNEDPSKNRREPRLRKMESFADYYNRPFIFESSRNDIYNGSISAGVELEKYAKKSGGIDKDDMLATATILKKGKLPSAKQIPGDTEPRDKIFSIMGKHLAKKYLKKYKGSSPALDSAMKEEEENYVVLFTEAYKYKIDHKTYTAAVEEALIVADKAGYEVDMDDYFNKVATGPRKPNEGKTNIFKIALEKQGKEQKKKLQIQIYGKGKHGYELNCYIA